MKNVRAHPDLTSETPFDNIAAPEEHQPGHDLVPPAPSYSLFTRATLDELWSDHAHSRRRHSFEKRRI